MATCIAPVKWAQRKDKIYLTIELRDIKDEKVEWVTPTKLKFSCTSDNKSYQVELEFFGEVNVEESKWNVTGLHGQFVLYKKDNSAYWKRLVKDDKKHIHISVDWSKWVDEDEEDEEGDKGLGMDWNPDNMRGFGGEEGNGDEEEEENDHGHHHGHDHGHDHAHDHGHDHSNCQGHDHHHETKEEEEVTKETIVEEEKKPQEQQLTKDS